MPVMIGSHRLGRLGRLAAAAAVAIVAGLAVPAAAHAADSTRIEFVNDGSGKCLDVRSEDGSANSGKFLDVRQGSHDDHAIVQQWTCNGTAAQRWTQVYVVVFQ